MTQLLVRKGEAAAILAVCERTIDRMAKAGDLQVVRVGRRGVRFREADVRELAARLQAGN